MAIDKCWKSSMETKHNTTRAQRTRKLPFVSGRVYNKFN